MYINMDLNKLIKKNIYLISIFRIDRKRNLNEIIIIKLKRGKVIDKENRSVSFEIER